MRRTLGPRVELEIVPDAPALAEAAARRILAGAEAALAARGRFTIALSGGSTPLPAYRRLADLGSALDWPQVHVLWGDERLVPPDDAKSNYGHAREALLAQVPIPEENVHRVRTELGEAAADDYEALLREVLGARGEAPRLDLVVLGLGEDGHTASLFPHDATLRERTRLVAVSRPQDGVRRVTLTYPALEAAAAALFLASGERKADVLARVLEGPAAPEALPAQAVRLRDGDVTWLVDDAAASSLSLP